MESAKTDTASVTLKEPSLHTICSVCFKTYNDPRILPCLHSFCLQCLHHAIENGGSQEGFQCPTCEKYTSLPVGGATALPQNLHLGFETLLAGYVSNKVSSSCDHCIDGRNGPAVVFCCTCRQYLCKPCDDHHKSGRQQSKHNIVGLDQEGHLQAIMNSREHYHSQPNQEENKLNFYCETCKCLMHMHGDCIPAAHKEHDITELSAFAKNHRRAIKEVLESAREIVARVTEAIDVNNKVREQMMISKMNAQVAINKAFETLQQALDLRKETLLSELEHISLSKTTALTLQKETFEKIIREISCYTRVAVHSLQTHTDYEIAALGGLIQTELSAVLKNAKPITVISNIHHGVSSVVPTDGLVGELSKFGNVIDLSPSPSSSTWTSTSVAKVKSDFNVKIETKTSKGSMYPHGGLQAKVEMKSSNGAVVHGEVEDHGDGTYTTTIIPLTAGPHQLLITLDGQHVQNSPHDVNVLHNDCNFLCTVQKVYRCQNRPFGVAIHDNGDLYVCSYADCIYVYDTTGHCKRTLCSPGTGDGQLFNPYCIIIKENIIYVADHNHSYLQRITLEGTFINKASVNAASGVLVDEYYRIYVSDASGNKIHVLNHNGGLIFTIDGNVTGDHGFRSPYGLAFDPLGNIHVAASGSNTIKVLTKEGVYIRKYGDLKGPRGIAIDGNGYSFVTEYSGKCFSIFNPQGNKIHSVGDLSSPWGLVLDSKTNSLYVCDDAAQIVLKYSIW